MYEFLSFIYSILVCHDPISFFSLLDILCVIWARDMHSSVKYNDLSIDEAGVHAAEP
jgi:hypothetical protein